MTSKKEIVELKKQIKHLKDHNSKLSELNQEYAEKVGELQNQLLNVKNKDLFLESSKIKMNKELLKNEMQSVFLQEKKKLSDLQLENTELKEKINLKEKEIKDSQIFIQKLQREKNEIQQQLNEFSDKHEAKDFIDKFNALKNANLKKDEENQKLMKQWNELCDKMEKVLCENRVLRQIADVPDNFGIDINTIKMKDREKIEDYKAKIRFLRQEVDDLETERAQLKNKLLKMCSKIDSNSEPYSSLTPEQKLAVLNYANDLSNGTRTIPETNYELKKQIQELQMQLDHLRQNGVGFSQTPFNLIPTSSSLDKTMPKGRTNLDFINEIGSLKEGQKKILELISQGNPSAFTTGFNNGFIPKTGSLNLVGNTTNTINPNTQDIRPYLDLGLMQLPAIPLRDFVNNAYVGMYRYNSIIKLESDKVHQIFGVCLEDDNCDKLKMESAALQSQILELLEIESRRNKNDETLNENMKYLYGKFEKICLIQNEVFFRYMQVKNGISEKEQKNAKNMAMLQDEIEILKTNNTNLTNDINNLRGNSDINSKYLEKIQEIAILEAKLIKLQRQYNCLFEEEGKLREFLNEKEQAESEKDKTFKDVVTKLKAWKNMLMHYLKLLMKKLKNSVDKKSFDLIATENGFLREKNRELMSQDLSLTKMSCLYKNIRNDYKTLEKDFYECEELKLDAQIEVNLLRRRICDLDPKYKLEQNAFKKLIKNIKEQNLTYQKIKNTFCKVHLKDESKAEQKQTRISGVLEGLNMDNSIIPKEDFESGLSDLNLNATLTKEDLSLIYKYIYCDDTKTVDVRYLLKKMEQFSFVESQTADDDKEVLFKFINCVKNTGKNLLSIFEFFDMNNNGCITRDEFKYALNQMNFPISDETIQKLVLLVTDNTIDKFTLNESDTFNYKEFCYLFEQKSRNLVLNKRKNEIAKANFSVDWKTNALTEIYSAIEKLNIVPEQALYGYDRHVEGFIDLQEFVSFVDNLNTKGINRQNKEKLFYDFDKEQKGMIPKQSLIEALENTKRQIYAYKEMMNIDNTENSIISIKRKLDLATEEKQYLNYKLNQMNKKVLTLEDSNNDIEKELETYKTKNEKIIKKYYEIVSDLQDFKEKYVDTGITRKELNSIEEQNDQLTREVTILRVGLNTFKELYNSANHQNKYIHVKNCIDKEELETYKKAVKELQSENNQNALIGKLYYTILLSRWREANVSKKYDEFSLNFNSLKEDNFQMKIQNQTLTKDLTEITNHYQDKVIENMLIFDELDNYRNGFNGVSSKDYFTPYDNMKKLIKTLTQDKIKLSENNLILKKDNLQLENEKNELVSQISYSQELLKKIKFENNDEYSKKLIQYCDEISKLKISDNQNKREKQYHIENEEHLNKIKKQLEDENKKLEEQNTIIEGKLRKIEDVYMAKDDERQKRLINALEKLKIYTNQELADIFNGKDISNKSIEYNIPSNKQTQLMQTYPLNANQNVLPDKTNTFNYSFKSSQMSNNSNEDLSKFSKEELIKKYEDITKIINFKDKEIEKLKMLNLETKAQMEQTNKFYEENSISNLVGETGYKKLRNEDAQIIAETAQKTIKTLQEMINQKNSLITLKDNQIERLNNEGQQMKVNYLKQISALQDQIKNDHDSTMKKLGNIIDNTNPNLVAKMSRSDLSFLTLNDLEKLINEKDNAIKALATELKYNKEEKDNIYFELGEKNKKIFELEDQLKLIKYSNNNKNTSLDFNDKDNIKSIYEEKMKQLEKEKEDLEKMKIEFANKLEETNTLKEANLDNTSYVPERLVVNKEKSDLYIKIEKLRKKISKLTDEKKQMLKEKEDFENDKKKLQDRIYKIQYDSKLFQQSQARDLDKISKLHKENDKLKKEKELLIRDKDILTEKLRKSEYEIDRLSKKNSNPPLVKKSSKINMTKKEDLKSSFSSKSIEHNINNSNSNMSNTQPLPKTVIKKDESLNKNIKNDKLQKLVYLCLNKRISLYEQLKRFDFGRTGKITTDQFRKSIEELKLGFINSDYDLLEQSAQASDGFISIDKFVEITKNVDPNYKEFLENTSNRVFDTKTTKKYEPFQNKNYNINY